MGYRHGAFVEPLYADALVSLSRVTPSGAETIPLLLPGSSSDLLANRWLGGPVRRLHVGKDSHTWLRNTVVTSYDDHDQVRKGRDKARFCADSDGPTLALAALALNVTTLGIPCVYYGSEQALDGQGGGEGADRYLREALFGGEFGAFRSHHRHVFDEDNRLYRALAELLALRRREPALRRGRQYLREISGNGQRFGLPTGFGGRLRGVVAWSRILADRELLCAINTDPAESHSAWVTIDVGPHRPADQLSCLYHSQPGPHDPLTVEERNGTAVLVNLPAGAFAIHART